MKLQLFWAIYPDYLGIDRPADLPFSRKDWTKFSKQINSGRRWNEMEVRLGPGIFASILSIVSHTWVEKTIPNDVFYLWLDLIKEHNTDAVTHGELVLAELRDILAGDPICFNQFVLAIESYSDKSPAF
jgi:hypothetical protein